MGGALDWLREDLKDFTTDAAGFTAALVFENPDGTVTATVNGVATMFHMTIDAQGVGMNAQTCSCTVSEAALKDADYPVRTGNKVALKGHKVSWKDASNVTKQYIIDEWYPDDTFGLLVLTLSDYE